jgi:hypothetical protein
MNPQYQQSVSALQTDTGILEDEYSSLEQSAGSGKSFSRYGIGLDFGGGDNEYNGTSGDADWNKDDGSSDGR